MAVLVGKGVELAAKPLIALELDVVEAHEHAGPRTITVESLAWHAAQTFTILFTRLSARPRPSNLT
jgi:hypothetical protein